MRPLISTVGPLTAASANAVALSQSLATAGALTLNGALATGGVATLPQPRRVGITSAGNDSGMTWTIVGTDRNGNPATETLTGATAGNTAQSALDYKTVTSITGSAAATSTVTAGTTGVASSQWLRMDEWTPSQVSVQCDVTGTVNYTVESTLDDPNNPVTPVAAANVVWISTSDTAAVTATASVQTNFNFAPTYVRVTLNSGTGSVRITAVQNSNAT